jgi:GNAT superfamily N-acetyltransferase
VKDELYARCYTRLLDLLGIEYSCSPADLRGSRNILTVSAANPGRRQYAPEAPYFQMVTLGNCAAVTADRELHPFLKGWMGERTGHWLFEYPNLAPLERELETRGYRLTSTFHMFLPCSAKAADETEYPVRWFPEGELDAFYGDARFPNAILPKRDPLRPDRMAVCAYSGSAVMGMAGCSEDAPHWQQIGIDVLPEYRSRGVAAYLVRLMREKILEWGDIPFYGTGIGNYHSWNVALNSGFRPTWLEIGAKKL